MELSEVRATPANICVCVGGAEWGAFKHKASWYVSWYYIGQSNIEGGQPAGGCVKTCYVHTLYLPANILNKRRVTKCWKLFNDATTFSETKERGVKNVLDINYNYQRCLEDLSAIQLGTDFCDLPNYVTQE